MRESDFDEFTSMLDAVCSLISRGNYAPNEANTALWFRSLQAHELAVVRAAFDAHVKDPVRGRFVPTPADVLAQIEVLVNDGRPGVEEAWAMVPQHESDTAVWTTEMAEAYGVASPLIAAGDKVGARMAFKEVYTRAVTLAKAAGRPAEWTLSLGSDLQHRRRTLRAAVEAGRITAAAAEEACPRIGSLSKLLLSAPEHLRAGITAGKEKLDANVEAWRKEPNDPKRWARDLKAREESGEDISPAQRAAWRAALAYSAPGAPKPFDGFKPIPDELLPPAMRKGQTPQQRRRAAVRAEMQALQEERT